MDWELEMNTSKKLSYYKILFIVLALFFLQTALALAQPIRVVAAFPDLADITRQIGKELVTVDALGTGVEDPHSVPVKPSMRGSLRFWMLRVTPKFCPDDRATSMVRSASRFSTCPHV
jgi:hypothetical protein